MASDVQLQFKGGSFQLPLGPRSLNSYATEHMGPHLDFDWYYI